MDAEMPLWKQPFLVLDKVVLMRGRSGVEAFSGIFYFKPAHPSSRASWKCGSRDRRSASSSSSMASTVRLQWSDLQASGAVIPLGAKPDDHVEFIVSMDRQ